MKLPPFVKVVREVTDENSYETWLMALDDYRMPEADVFAISESLLNEKANDPAQALILERMQQSSNAMRAASVPNPLTQDEEVKGDSPEQKKFANDSSIKE